MDGNNQQYGMYDMVDTGSLYHLENEVQRRAGHVLVVYNEKVFLWGGYMEQPHRGTYDRMTESITKYHKAEHIWIYEPLIDVWYRKTCSGKIPNELSGSFSAVYENYLYIFGGYFYGDSYIPYDGVKNLLWRLDLESFVWELMQPKGDPPYAADKGTGWAYNGRFYVFGGFGNINDVNRRQFLPYSGVSFVTESEYAVSSRGWFDQLVYYDIAMNRWEWPKCSGNRPSARAAHAITVLKNKAYMFGGRHKAFRLNDFYSLDLNTHEWTLIDSRGPAPEGRSWHTLSAMSNHQLVLYGGFSTVCQVLKDSWMFDLKTSDWHELKNGKSSPRLWHCSVGVQPSELICVGGLSSNILDNSHAKDHAEEMLFIRFSPPSLFKLCLEYLTKRHGNRLNKYRQSWDQLAPILKQLLKARVDPFEIHGRTW